MKNDRRGSWYLLTGAVIGVALGLIYSWVISPVEYVDAPPYALRADFKDEYRALVAAAYLYSNDLLRAKDRLAQLKDEESAQTVAMQAQRALAEGHPEGEVKALGILAMALGNGTIPDGSTVAPTQKTINTPTAGAGTPTPIIQPLTDTPDSSQQATPIQMSTNSAPQTTYTWESLSTTTSTPNQGEAFLLQEQKLLCNLDQSQPMIMVEMQDSAGEPMPSVEMVVTWDGGEDHFFTGLKPELSLGYGDFLMTPGVVYSLHPAESGQTVSDLTAAECLSDDGSRYWGSWMLTFVQP
jgi:hypothetical protein